MKNNQELEALYNWEKYLLIKNLPEQDVERFSLLKGERGLFVPWKTLHEILELAHEDGYEEGYDDGLRQNGVLWD